MRNGGTEDDADNNLRATFVSADIMCKFIMPPPSHQSKRMNSFPLPSFDVVRYEKAGTSDLPGNSGEAQSSEIAYVNYDEAPSYLQFCVRPSAKSYPKKLLAYNHG